MGPMSYSIFDETMADMTYQQIEEAARQKLPVLFPIAVIEEHGPHMCLGTDTYLTYHFCKLVKKSLSGAGIDSLIAPPYYWGINVATNGFAGTFTVKPATMVSILCDLLECFKTWGFENIFLFNFHGDFSHMLTITDAVKRAREDLGVAARFIAPDFFIRRAGLSGEEPYIIVQPTQFGKPSAYPDLHAGGSETSLMAKDFPALVNVEEARSLKSSLTAFQDLKVWERGGEEARKITPLGYCGDPSKIDLEAAEVYEEKMIGVVSKTICELLKGNSVR